MRLVRYLEGMTLFAEIDPAEWEDEIKSLDVWTKQNDWRYATEQEILRSMMVPPAFRVKRTAEGRSIEMWSIREK